MLARKDAPPLHSGPTLYCFGLDRSKSENELAYQTLSPEEKQRAQRFHFDRDRERYVAARARLRCILATALEVAPVNVQLTTGAFGKPCLAGAQALSGLQFNISHSGSRALCGIAWNRSIGVDIECWRPMRDADALVQRFFSPSEAARYEALPSAQRQQAFFDGWTRKEAFVKALGQGLSFPLRSFSVSLDTSVGMHNLEYPTIAAEGVRWSLLSIAVDHGVSAAFVIEGDVCHVERAE
jgi:4'-phosphopantetheinyl transferase